MVATAPHPDARSSEPVTADEAVSTPTPAVPVETLQPADARSPAPTPIVAVEHAVRRFGDTVAVADISLEVQPGTILGVIGPSGAGKTTFVRQLTGALGPSEGTVEVLGEDPRRFTRATRERIGYMPQGFALYPDLTVSENVDLVASLFGLLWRTRHRRTREALQLVDLWGVRGRRASELSGGMQRRLELACALVHDPSLIFLDEPTAGLDPLLRARVWEALRQLRDAGRTLVVTTQYVTESESCDVVALIADGRVIAMASPEGLRRDAMGGDVVEIKTTEPLDPRALEPVTGVRSVQRIDVRRLRLVVDDAATVLPELVDGVAAAGGEVVSAQEERPSFDTVFANLIERERARVANADAEAAARTAKED